MLVTFNHTWVDHFGDFFLQVTVLSDVTLGISLDLLINFGHVFIQLLLEEGKSLLCELPHFVDRTFPLSVYGIFLFLFFDCHNEKEVIFIFSVCEMARIVTHQLQFSLSGVDITILSDLIEGVRHDGDQHVQHSDLRKSSRQNEEWKAE